MRFPPGVALLLCLVVPAAGADSNSSGISVDSSVSSSTTSVSTSADGQTHVVTSTTSSTSSKDGGNASGTTSCRVDAGDRRCEVSCPAPKVARCVEAAAGRMPRCSCQ